MKAPLLAPVSRLTHLCSLADDWIVNETYPSREGWALDKSGFVITAGTVWEARIAQRKGLYFFLSNLFLQGALHLPCNQLLPPGLNTLSFLLFLASACHFSVLMQPLIQFDSFSVHLYVLELTLNMNCVFIFTFYDNDCHLGWLQLKEKNIFLYAPFLSCILDLRWKLCRHAMQWVLNEAVKSISKLSKSEQGELCHVTAFLREVPFWLLMALNMKWIEPDIE